MKVLHVLNTLRFSGAELMLFSAAPVFMGGGDQHTILATGEVTGEFASRLAERGYRIEHRPFRRNPAYLLSFVAYLRRSGFDAVHIHTERAGFWYCIAALLAGARPVRSIHNAFGYEGALKWRRGLQRRILTWLGVPLVVGSEIVRRNEQDRFGIATRLIDNWIDADRFPAATLARRGEARHQLGLNEGFVLVSVGNCGPAKNHAAIIRALAKLPSGLDARYVHIGTGDDQHDEVHLAQELSVVENISFVPHAANTQDYLVAADAYISTSHFEGGQIALLEATAIGVPCVTTRVGLADQFEGLANMHFVGDDTVTIVGAIESVAAQPLGERIENAVELSEFTRRRFVPAVGAREYMALYRGDRVLPQIETPR